MNTVGCFAIVKKNNCVLLVKRRDVPLWDLPGGRLDKNETLQACAIREVLEETGYICEITELIGTYSRPSFNDTQVVYKGHVIGGCPITQGDETKQLHWFPVKRLPLCMVPNRRMQIKDELHHQKHLEKTLHDRHLLSLLLKLQRTFKKK